MDECPGYPGEQDDDQRADRHNPVADPTAAESLEKITEQRHGAGMEIGPVGIRAEDPIAYEPDGERYKDRAKKECACDEDQLAAKSRPDGEHAADAG